VNDALGQLTKKMPGKKIASQSGSHVRVGQPCVGLESSFNPTTRPAILYGGISAPCCAFLLCDQAIVILDSLSAGEVYCSLPSLTGFLGCLFLGEAIGIVHLFVLVVILTAFFMANQSAR
jgi:hypothetical protein